MDYRILFYTMVALNVVGLWLIRENRKLIDDLLKALRESNQALSENTADWSKITGGLIGDLKAVIAARKGTDK